MQLLPYFIFLFVGPAPCSPIADELAYLLTLRTRGYDFSSTLQLYPQLAPFLACDLCELYELHDILSLPTHDPLDHTCLLHQSLQNTFLARGRKQYPFHALQDADPHIMTILAGLHLPNPLGARPPEFAAAVAQWLRQQATATSVTINIRELILNVLICRSRLRSPFWRDVVWPSQLSADLLSYLLHRNAYGNSMYFYSMWKTEWGETPPLVLFATNPLELWCALNSFVKHGSRTLQVFYTF